MQGPRDVDHTHAPQGRQTGSRTLLHVCRMSWSSGRAPWGRRRRGGWRGEGVTWCCSSSSSRATSTDRAMAARGSSGSRTTSPSTCAWRRRRCRCGASSRPTRAAPLLDTTGAVDHGDPASVAAVAAALETCGAEHEVIPAAEAVRTLAGDALRRATSSSIPTAVAAGPTTRCVRCRTAPRRSAPTSVRHRTGRACATTSAGVEVDAGGETIRAPVAVVTAGAWVREVRRRASSRRDVTVTQEQIQHFAPRHRRRVAELHPPPAAVGVRAARAGRRREGGRAPRRAGGRSRPTAAARPRGRSGRRPLRRASGSPASTRRPCMSPSVSTRRRPTSPSCIERRGPIVIGSPCSGHGFKFTPAHRPPPRRPRLPLTRPAECWCTRGAHGATIDPEYARASGRVRRTRGGGGR